MFSKNLSLFTGIWHSFPHIVEYQEVSWFGLQVLRRAEETVLGGKAGSVMREKSAINPVTPAGCHFVAAKRDPRANLFGVLNSESVI